MKGNFYDNERVALFIDGANLYSAARALGFDIDYRRLLKVFREKGRAGPRLLLHRAGRGSGVLADPAADRLAGLQRLHAWSPSRPRNSPTPWAAARSRATWTSSSPSTCWRWPSTSTTSILFSGDGDFRRAGRGGAAQGRARLGGLHHQVLAADGGRRAAPPGRRLHRARRAGAADRAQPVASARRGQPRQRRTPSEDDAPST